MLFSWLVLVRECDSILLSPPAAMLIRAFGCCMLFFFLFQDDDFASIVEGVRAGRTIFDTIAYTCSHLIPETVPTLLTLAFDLPAAIPSLAILAIDLGTELAPAISFAYEVSESDVMARQVINHIGCERSPLSISRALADIFPFGFSLLDRRGSVQTVSSAQTKLDTFSCQAFSTQLGRGLVTVWYSSIIMFRCRRYRFPRVIG